MNTECSPIAPETTALIKELTAPRRFLVVDDDAGFCEQIRHYAEDYNCQMDVAPTIEKAKELFANDNYEFVWVDVRLESGRSGLEFFREIKLKYKYKPMLILSAYLTSAILEEIAKIGVAFIMVKPMITREVIGEMFAFMGVRRKKGFMDDAGEPMITIDIDKIQETGHSLPPANTNPAPGYICLYTGPGGQHCIIGEICSRLGLDVPTLDETDNKVAIGYLAVKGRWAGRFEPAAIVWAATAQLLGQMGYPWAVCVQSADNSVAAVIKMPQSPGANPG